MLMRMLGNRNLNWWQSAETFTRLTGGHLYLSAATVGAVGRDVNRLTPDSLVGFAVVLEIPAGDLAALGDVRLPDGGVPEYPVPADMAVLIWEVRRLTAEQVQGVLDEVSAVSGEPKTPTTMGCSRRRSPGVSRGGLSAVQGEPEKGVDRGILWHRGK